MLFLVTHTVMFQVDPNFANLQYSVSHIPKCSTYIPILRIFNIPCAETSVSPCVRACTHGCCAVCKPDAHRCVGWPKRYADTHDSIYWWHYIRLSMAISYQASLCQSRESIHYCVATHVTLQYQVVFDRSRSPKMFHIRASTTVLDCSRSAKMHCILYF